MKKNQSGFRPHCSTEAVLITITNDLVLASDHGCISIVLLDLIAALETIDQKKTLRLKITLVFRDRH